MAFSVFDEPRQPRDNQAFVLGLLIVGLIGFFFASNVGLIEFDNNPVPVIDQEQDREQVAPSEDGPALGETYVVRVYESKHNEAWFNEQVRNDNFWVVKLPELGIGLEYFDPYDDDGNMNPQAESFIAAAESRGVDSKAPYWIHAHRGKVLSITPFSENVDQDEWEAIIRKSCKE